MSKEGNKESKVPWSPGTKLRVLVNIESDPDIDYMPCFPMSDHDVTEIENGSWVTYQGERTFGDAKLYLFDYYDAEVLIPAAMLPHLKYVHQRPARRKRYR